MKEKATGMFMLGDGQGTVVIGSTGKGKSLMPDSSELTNELAKKAFELIGSHRFEVSANLSVDNPASLRAYGQLQSILLMAYQEGQKSVKNDAA